MKGDYVAWCQQFALSYPGLSAVLCALPYLDIRQRKVLLAYCRVQPPVNYACRFYSRHQIELRSPLELPTLDTKGNYVRFRTLWEMIETLEPYEGMPICYSIISGAVRAAPYQDYSSVIDTRAATITKEIEASQSTRGPSLCYNPILSDDHREGLQTLMSNTPQDYRTARMLHACLSESRKRLHGMVFWPRIPKKTIGREGMTQANYQTAEMELDNGRGVMTLQDVERVYAETGVRLSGPVEMRTAWKYNDLKPRCYYAQGPSVYHDAKYIQPIFNVICDSLPPCHRLQRYEPPRNTMMTSAIRMGIYDYESFTSRLTQIRQFVAELAKFYEGTDVILVDSFEGPITVDLGQLLLDFNATSNTYPEFDVSRVLCTGDTALLYHAAGMLGVPGNITSSTILHSLHVAVLIRSLYNCKCIGDDALVLLEVDDDAAHAWLAFLDGVQNLGRVVSEKAEFWDHDASETLDGWQYAKRPIARFTSIVITGVLLILPGLEVILGLSDEHHQRTDLGPHERISKFLKQWRRFLTRLHIDHPGIEGIEASILLTWYRAAEYNVGLYDLRRNFRSSPFATHGKALLGIIPLIRSEEDFREEWKSMTIRRWTEDGNRIELRLPEIIGEEECPPYVSGGTGYVFGRPKWKHLASIGAVELVMRKKVYVLDPSCDVFLMNFLLNDSYYPCYDVQFLRDPPTWLYSLDAVISNSRSGNRGVA